MILTSKLSVKISLRPLAFKLTYKRDRFVDKRGLTRYDFTQSLRFVRPKLRWPRLRCSDGSWLPLSCIIQDILLVCGIAACNPFREECASAFECCSWGLSDKDKAILSSLVSGNAICSGVYVASEDFGECRCCGEERDLRLGVCFNCYSEVDVEEIVDGVTACSNKRGDVWMF